MRVNDENDLVNLYEKLCSVEITKDGNGTNISCNDFTKYDMEELISLNNRSLINILQRTNFLPSSKTCATCQTELITLYFEKDRHPFFRCNNRTCRPSKRISLFENTIFALCKLPMSQVLELLWQFSCRRSNSDTVETLNISSKTVTSYFRLFRSSLKFFVDERSEKIGGNGIIVHLDETSITSRKYGRGRSRVSNTVWVVGGVDIHSRKVFLKFLPSRSREDLTFFLQNYIEPGSIIHTDCLRSYNNIRDLGFSHFTVNHSRELVSREGVHTNWIEGIFGAVKRLRRKYDSHWTNNTDLDTFLAEFCFRYAYSAFDRKKAFLKILGLLKVVREEIPLILD